MNKKFLIFFLLTIFIQNYSIAGKPYWEYRDWKTEPLSSDNYLYSTNGQVVNGNQFGFWIDKSNCSQSVLWLTISTYEEGLSEHKGDKFFLTIKVDDKESFIIAPLKAVSEFTPTMHIALFSDVVASDQFIQDLKKGNSVSFTVSEPEQKTNLFDIKTETFSLSGFSAHHLKATEACKKGDKELEIPPSTSKEQFRQNKLAEYLDNLSSVEVSVENIISDTNICDSYFTADNIDAFKKLIDKYPLRFEIKDHYLFSGEGSDGGSPYPRIQVSNICNFNKPLPVTEILKTDQQVFQMQTRGNLLFIMANYDSREYILKEEDDFTSQAVFQIIDIENIENIKVLGEIVFEGLVPNFTVDSKYAYIENRENLMILDISNPKQIEKQASIPLSFDKFGSDSVAVNDSHIFVTGNNVLKIIDNKSARVTQELKFDFRTGDIVVKNNYIYILGWRNGWNNSKIAFLEFSEGRAKLRSIFESKERMSSFKLFDEYLVGKQGKGIFQITGSGGLKEM